MDSGYGGTTIDLEIFEILTQKLQIRNRLLLRKWCFCLYAQFLAVIFFPGFEAGFVSGIATIPPRR
jgi:hypothetical protein